MRIAALSLPLIYYLYTAADRHSSLWQLRWAFQSPPAEWAWRRALPLRSQLLLIGELSLLYKICTTPKCDNPPKEYELHVGRCAVRASDLTSHLPCNYWGRGDPLNGAEDDMPLSAGAQAPSWSDSPMTQWTRRQQQTAGHIALVFLFITQLEGWHRDSSVREIPRPNSEGPNSLLIHHLFISLSCVPAMGQTVFLNLDPGIPRWTWCIGTSPTGQHPLVAGDARSTNLWRTLWKEPFQRGWLTMKAKQTNKQKLWNSWKKSRSCSGGKRSMRRWHFERLGHHSTFRNVRGSIWLHEEVPLLQRLWLGKLVFKKSPPKDTPSFSLLLILITSNLWFHAVNRLASASDFQDKMWGNLTVLPVTNIIDSSAENFLTQCCCLELYDLVYHQRYQTDSDVHDLKYAYAILRGISRIRDCQPCRRHHMQTHRGSRFNPTLLPNCVN